MPETLTPSSDIPENIAPQINIEPSPSSTFPKTPLIILVILIVLLILGAAGYFIYSQGYFLQFGAQPASPTPSPTPPQAGGIVKSYNTEGFDKCVFRKDKDNLVTLAEVQEDGTIFVRMGGNIMDIQLSSNEAVMTLVAPTGSQGYQFTLPVGEQIVWDSPQATTAKMVSELKSFLSVNVYATCNPKATAQKLTINQINIIADLTKPSR